MSGDTFSNHLGNLLKAVEKVPPQPPTIRGFTECIGTKTIRRAAGKAR